MATKEIYLAFIQEKVTDWLNKTAYPFEEGNREKRIAQLFARLDPQTRVELTLATKGFQTQGGTKEELEERVITGLKGSLERRTPL